jgi:hypothetical protein
MLPKIRASFALLFASLLALSAMVAPVSAAPAAAEQCFPQTGFCVRGRFLDYWNAHGGLAINGYPLTGEFVSVLEDGNAYTVQYFERVRMEYHRENAPPHDVLLGQFGRRILKTNLPSVSTAPVPPLVGYTHFPETGHNVGPRFAAYWQANGGLAQFGYPLTELFTHRLEDNKEYQVQYFERARFEYHPEYAGTPSEVLLGQFGRRVLRLDSGKWLGQSQPANWNAAGTGVPPANVPVNFGAAPGQCSDYAPAAPSAEEIAVVNAGWKLVRPVLSGNGVTIVYGLLSYDGMCRPMQLQLFVFVQGTFAGTLSPLTMNSREDGMVSNVEIGPGGHSIQATYQRYSDTDPLCCPSLTSTVRFAVDAAIPLGVPATITTEQTVH